jgi:hypothetical protein
VSDDTAKEAEELPVDVQLNRKLAELRKTALDKQRLELSIAQRKQAVDDETADEHEVLVSKEKSQTEEAANLFLLHLETLTGGKVKYVQLENGKVALGPDRESFDFSASLAEKWLRGIRKWLSYSKPGKRVIDKAKIQKDRSLVFSAPRDAMAFVIHQAVTIELEGLKNPLKHALPDRDVLPPKND